MKKSEDRGQRSEVRGQLARRSLGEGGRSEARHGSTRQLLAAARRLLLKLDKSRTVTLADHRERRLLIEGIEKLLNCNTSKLRN
jgi:hypothetical protein